MSACLTESENQGLHGQLSKDTAQRQVEAEIQLCRSLAGSWLKAGLIQVGPHRGEMSYQLSAIPLAPKHPLCPWGQRTGVLNPPLPPYLPGFSRHPVDSLPPESTPERRLPSCRMERRGRQLVSGFVTAPCHPLIAGAGAHRPGQLSRGGLVEGSRENQGAPSLYWGIQKKGDVG